MKKNVILWGLVGSLLWVGGSSYATPVTPAQAGQGPAGVPEKAPLTAQDFGRTLTGLAVSIIGLCGEGEAKAQLLAQQEENDQNACGTGGKTDLTDTKTGTLNLGTAGKSEFENSAFDYVNTYLLAKEGNVNYSPLKTALSSAEEGGALRTNIKKALLEAFFADPSKPDQSTTDYKKKIKQNRNEYMQKAANRHVSLAYKVKGSIKNDLEVIASAAVSGDGELGSIAVDAHTLEQMVKMELVDLALQIEMMEADAVQFLMHQPVELMTETKPKGEGK